jgi:threonine/homoserine efflux transporter RhtA
MKYTEVVTESRITNTTLALLFIFMGAAWYFKSSLWYNIVILIVSLAFIFHSINYYLTARNKPLGIAFTIGSGSFCFYNLLILFLW